MINTLIIVYIWSILWCVSLGIVSWISYVNDQKQRHGLGTISLELYLLASVFWSGFSVVPVINFLLIHDTIMDEFYDL